MSFPPRIKPRRLYPGDTIGIVAPASPSNAAAVQAGISWLESQGYRIKTGASVHQTLGFLAGSDELRAADIHRMFASPEIDGIICLRGGYGTMRLLALLDYDLIRANPKVFVGYSDITALHLSIGQRTGLITFHGPMAASDMSGGLSEHTGSAFFRAVAGNRPLGRISNPPAAPPPVFITPGRAEGRLTGGNLSLLAATLGTPYEIDTSHKIICIEEVGEAPYRIDRMLTQLLLAGKLQTAAGLVFAVCAACDGDDDEADFTVDQVLRERLGGLNIPVLYHLYFGHTDEKVTLPLGAKAILDRRGLAVKETATIA